MLRYIGSGMYEAVLTAGVVSLCVEDICDIIDGAIELKDEEIMCNLDDKTFETMENFNTEECEEESLI